MWVNLLQGKHQVIEINKKTKQTKKQKKERKKKKDNKQTMKVRVKRKLLDKIFNEGGKKGALFCVFMPF